MAEAIGDLLVVGVRERGEALTGAVSGEAAEEVDAAVLVAAAAAAAAEDDVADVTGLATESSSFKKIL